MASVLTDGQIRKIASAPIGKRAAYPDLLSPGLNLLVDGRGKKTWMVTFWIDKNRKKMSLGDYPHISLDVARDKARWVRDRAKLGADPRVAEAKKVKRQIEEVEVKKAQMFSFVADNYIQAAFNGSLLGARREAVTLQTAKARASRLNRLIIPSLGSRSIYTLTRIEIGKFLSLIESEGGPVDRCLQDIRLVYKFAIARGVFEGANSTDGLRKRQAQKVSARSLNDTELAAIWSVCDLIGYPFGPAVQLLILTGQRRDEIGNLTWNEVDFSRKMIVLPQAKVKNRKGVHEIPLSELSLDILTKLSHSNYKNETFVFTTTGMTPISGWSRTHEIIDRLVKANIVGLTDVERNLLSAKISGRKAVNAREGIRQRLDAVDFQHWRYHDLRHSVVTRLLDGDEDDLGNTTFSFPIDVVQQVVNHEITLGVTATYDHGELEKRYRLRKREALDWWSNEMKAILRLS